MIETLKIITKAKQRRPQCSILAKKVTCTCACNFKNLYAHNLVYMHMMWMMKYMHKIYVVLQGMVIPDDIPASISSLRGAQLMSQVMPHHLHCEIKTQHFHHCMLRLSRSICISIIIFFYFLLLCVSICSIPTWNVIVLSLCCAHRLTLWSKWLKTYMHMCM